MKAKGTERFGGQDLILPPLHEVTAIARKDYMPKRLPKRFNWTLHNIVAHPLSEILFQVGELCKDLGYQLNKLSDKVHDDSAPKDNK